MKHPTPEQLLPLIQAVDTACWCLAVKAHTKKGQTCRVDWKASLQELQEAWHMYQMQMDDKEAILSKESK